jgi:hypothetical protein
MAILPESATDGYQLAHIRSSHAVERSRSTVRRPIATTRLSVLPLAAFVLDELHGRDLIF